MLSSRVSLSSNMIVLLVRDAKKLQTLNTVAHNGERSAPPCEFDQHGDLLGLQSGHTVHID